LKLQYDEPLRNFAFNFNVWRCTKVIREKVDGDYMSRLNGALTSVRGVNKTDAATLGANFGSVAGAYTCPLFDST